MRATTGATMMQFAVGLRRHKMPLWFRRRTSFRNSLIRSEVSGYANYERIYLLGFDLTVQWGYYDKAKPDPARERRKAANRAAVS
jgi:hypothetical protein